jgi:hypothetical protein
LEKLRSDLILANYDFESWFRTKEDIIAVYGEEYFCEELVRRNANCEIAEALYVYHKHIVGGINGHRPGSRDSKEIR